MSMLWRSRGPGLRWWRGRLATWRRPSVVLLLPPPAAEPMGDDIVPSHDEAVVLWRDWCTAHPGQQCRVALSSRWLLCAWVASGAGDAAAQAAAQWERYLGVTPVALAEAWVLRVVALPGGTLLCAAPKVLVDDLLSVARMHRVKITWLGPWWARGAQGWLSQSRAGGDQGPDEAGHQLVAAEGDWGVHLQARAGVLQRVWTARGEAAGQRVCVPPQAHGLSDDSAAADLVQGHTPLWREAA